MDRQPFPAEFHRCYLPGGPDESFSSQPADGQFLRMNTRTGYGNHFPPVKVNLQMNFPDDIRPRLLPGRTRKNTDRTFFDAFRTFLMDIFHLFSLNIR
jgi:hypothetical protein